MLSRRYGTFSGGIELPDDKEATLHSPIEASATPRRLYVPLACADVAPAKPLVEPGDSVEAGQQIARAAGNGADVFAPLAGRVIGPAQVSVAGPHGWLSVPALELADFTSTWRLPFSPADAPPKTAEFQDDDPLTLRRKLSQAGLYVHRRQIEPLHAWIERALTKKVKTLIANAMEDQPYVSADHRLLVEYGRGALQGLTTLARAIGADHVLLAADQRHTEHYRSLDRREPEIARYALPHKYPIGADAVLVKVLTRREMPPGGTTMDVGAAVIDLATCLAIYRVLAMGQVPLGRVVTIGGERAPRPANCWAPVGMPCRELLPDDTPLLHGGPMNGLQCRPDSVVTFATDALLAVDAAPESIPTPCIRCGWCTDHCPARLNVAALNDAFELGLLQRAQRLGAQACMDCGVCSYICPARLPLSQRVRQLKGSLARAGVKPPAAAEKP